MFSCNEKIDFGFTGGNISYQLIFYAQGCTVKPQLEGNDLNLIKSLLAGDLFIYEVIYEYQNGLITEIEPLSSVGRPPPLR